MERPEHNPAEELSPEDARPNDETSADALEDFDAPEDLDSVEEIDDEQMRGEP